MFTVDQTVILDGGMSNALEDRGHDLSDALWSARLLKDAPGEIAAVHRAYYEAGAAVATTASYQASVGGFERVGVDRDEAEKLIASSVSIARQVRDELAIDGRPRWVAASVGPYGAVLADGSEYRGRYGLSAAALREFHLPRLELLVAAGPDVLAVETIPDVDEAEVLVELLDELGFPAWLSYSIEGTRTRAGQSLEDAFAVAARSTAVKAVGINCCAPSDVQAAVEIAVEATGKPAVAYPNSGETWDAVNRRWADDGSDSRREMESTPTPYRTGGGAGSRALIQGWTTAGARFVGGCCRVGPSDIAALATALAEATH